MKRVFTIFTVMLGIATFSQAQVNPHAIGLRLGGGNGGSAEISYQQGVGEANRFEFDLGFHSNKDYNGMTITGTYQWDWNLTAGLNWFVGPGAGIGLYNSSGDDGMSIGLGGQIGLEYDFQDLGAPILVSLDARPMFGVSSYASGLGWGGALGIRYIF